MRKYSISILLLMIAVCAVSLPCCQAQSISGSLGLQPGILAVDAPVTTSANSIASEMTADPAAMPAIPQAPAEAGPAWELACRLGFWELAAKLPWRSRVTSMCAADSTS